MGGRSVPSGPSPAPPRPSPATHRTTPFYAPRRVPQAFPPAYLRARVLPLLPGVLVNALVAGIASAPVVPEEVREAARERSEVEGTAILERAQRIFFDEPGLDTLLIRSIASSARRLTTAGRAYLRALMALHLDADHRAATMLPLVPRRGYDSLMTSVLAVGTALGQFRGGEVHSRIFHDSARCAPGEFLEVPSGHPTPQVRRFGPPSSLGDLAADIDDLYWAMSFGQPVKVTRVGGGERRRWLVSLPGTDHMTPESTPNPADLETNVREVLNLPSAMRVGLVHALHDAMRADGVPRARWSAEPVLVCGHSQGGMVATALAAADPGEVGVDVRGVLALGSPSRRLVIREDVTMLAIAHDQDVVPATDGTPQRVRDQRVTVGRRLVRPRQGPLYYAHSSATYTETVRQVERKSRIAPWGRVPEAVSTLQAFLPRTGEETRVTLHDIWQDVLEPRRTDQWDTYISLDRPDWEPVHWHEDWSPAPLVDLSAVELPDLSQIQERATELVEGWTSGVTSGVTSATGGLRAAVDSALHRIVPDSPAGEPTGGVRGDGGGNPVDEGGAASGTPTRRGGPGDPGAAGTPATGAAGDPGAAGTPESGDDRGGSTPVGGEE